MASSKQLINSLLTEHFRYTPLTLVDEIINTVNEVIYKAVTGIEEGLRGASPALLGFEARAQAEGRAVGGGDAPEAAVEIEEGVHKLETLLGATVDRNFDKTEIYMLRNILSVPEELLPWMRLGHYKGLEFEQAPRRGEPTIDSLFALRRRAHETQRLHQALIHESKRNAAVIAQLRSVLHGSSESTEAPDVSFLTQGAAAKAVGASLAGPDQEGLTQHTQQALAGLPALKDLLERLKPLANAAGSLPPSSGAADERRQYIEAQVRRQLERQGADLASGDGLLGPGLDGSQAARVGKDEVGSIEGVARALGQGGEGRQEKRRQDDEGEDEDDEDKATRV